MTNTLPLLITEVGHCYCNDVLFTIFIYKFDV